MNLIKVIEQIKSDINKLESQKERQIENINKEFNKKINDLETALQINMELNTTCLECEGRGRISFLDAAGDTDYEVCSRCNGKGLEPKF